MLSQNNMDASNPITNARVAMKAFAALKPVSQIKTFTKSESTETVKPKASKAAK
jgi:hypothetical protein